jgi:hypothetical protein
MKTYRVVEINLHVSLISVLKGSEQIASRLNRFTLEERGPVSTEYEARKDPKPVMT